MTAPYGLDGRVALVTGGTRGIGLAVAGALVRAGARVCVTARDPDGVAQAAEALGGVGLAGSVADPAHLRLLTEFTLDAFGRIDILVNNAATNLPYGPLMDADPDTWRAAFTVNVEAPLRLTQCVWRAWMRQHGGSVVNICRRGRHPCRSERRRVRHQQGGPPPPHPAARGRTGPRVRVNSVSPASSARRWPASSGSTARMPSPPGSPSAESANPRTSPERCCGWHPTRRSGSPGRTYWWTGNTSTSSTHNSGIHGS